mgnify:CR=1 FL=1
MKGIAVYTPGIVRKVNLLLNKPSNVDFIDGEFKVVYTKNESTKVLSKAVLKL